MQSCRKIKKVQDYRIGEHVREYDYDAGKVAAIVFHPNKKSVAYLLLINSHDEYSIYKGLTDCNAGLSLARNIPESVAIQFSEVILGAEPPALPEKPKKFPVLKEPVEEPTADLTKAPFFDFI